MKIHPLSAAVLLLVSGALAACGSTSATSSPATGSATSAPSDAAQASAPTQATTATDACKLITQPEATTALGSDPGPGKPRGTSGKACDYSASGGAYLGVNISPSSGTRAGFDSTKAQLVAPYTQAGGTVQDLPGLGDVAWVAASDHGGACAILKGTISAQVTIVTPKPLPSPIDTFTTLCRAMAGRI